MNKRTLKTPRKSGTVRRADIRSVIKAVHIMPKPGEGWVVRKIGDGRVSQQFASKKAAVEFAQRCQKLGRSRLIIHGRNGRIESNLGPQTLTN